MRRGWWLVMLVAMTAAAQETQTANLLPVPEIRIPKMAAPTIDGTIDAQEWSGAAEMQKVCLYRKADAFNGECMFWMGRDDENLYVAMKSEIGKFGLLKNVRNTGRSNRKCFDDDCLEFDFFNDWHAKRPTGAHYYVNFNGAFRVLGFIDGKTTEWDELLDFKTASKEIDGWWHLEFSVPLKAVKFDQAPGVTHSTRIARNFKRVDNGSVEGWFGYQCSWSAQDGSFGTAANSTKLTFDDAAPVVQLVDFGSHERGRNKVTNYPIDSVIRNPTAKPLTLRLKLSARPVNSQPTRFSEVFTLKPGEARKFHSKGEVLDDEPIAFNYEVTSADGQITYYRRDLVFKANFPPVGWLGSKEDIKDTAFRYSYYPSWNTICAELNLERAAKRPQPTPYTLTLKDDDGAVIATTNGAAIKAVTELEWKIPDLEPLTIKSGKPKYTLEVKVEGVKDGQIQGSFYRYDLREWEHNQLGKSATIPPPFEKVKREEVGVGEVGVGVGEVGVGVGEEGLEKVSVVLREHIVDKKTGLWQQVFAAGKPLLARPMRWVRLQSTAKAVEGNRTQSIAADYSFDVDGCCTVCFTLAPGHYEPLALEIPLKGAEARLMHACVDGLRNNYAGAVPAGEGRVWTSKQQGGRIQLQGDYLPYLWVGGCLRGIAVFGDNDKGWVIGEVKTPTPTPTSPTPTPHSHFPCTEILRESDGTVVIRLNVIQRAVDLTASQTIKLGFQATPVKPMLENWRAVDIGHMIGSTYYFGGAGGSVCPFDGKTEFWDKMNAARRTGKIDNAYVEDALKRFEYSGEPGSKINLNHRETIRRHFYAGMREMQQAYGHEPVKFVFYTNARGIEYGLPSGTTYCDEWTRLGYNERLNHVYGRCERRDYDLDPVDSFCDHAVYWYKQMLDSGACNALYWDDIYLSGNVSLLMTDAYRLPDGTIQPSVGLWRMRELIRRCAVMQAECGYPATDNWVHMTNTSIAPLLSFAGVSYDWEDTADLQTFQDRYGRDYLLASTIGRQYGNRVRVMGYISKTTPENLAWLERTGVGVCLTHEIDWQRVQLWREADRRLRDWGYRQSDTRVWNYWDEDVRYPIECTGEPNTSIAMAKGGEALVVICDWGEGGTVSVKPDVATLGIRTDFVATDLETGKPVPVEGGVIKVALKKHDYQMIRLH